MEETTATQAELSQLRDELMRRIDALDERIAARTQQNEQEVIAELSKHFVPRTEHDALKAKLQKQLAHQL